MQVVYLRTMSGCRKLSFALMLYRYKTPTRLNLYCSFSTKPVFETESTLNEEGFCQRNTLQVPWLTLPRIRFITLKVQIHIILAYSLNIHWKLRLVSGIDIVADT